MDDKRLSRSSARASVIEHELAWHEQKAYQRRSLDALLYDPPMFDSIVNSGLAFLAAEPDELVLDMGCGTGKELLELAARGHRVVGVDLSRAQLLRARQHVRARLPQTDVVLIQANAEALPFKAGAFRAIYGKAILHHLDLRLAAQEVGRLLRPEGRAAFAEPMASHPLFWLARHLTPKLRTQDERPLRLYDYRRFAEHFAASDLEEYFLLTPLAAPLRALRSGTSLFKRAFFTLQCADRWLLDRFPVLRKLAWYALVKVSK